MESFARCCPVVTTYIAGIPELVTPDNGWLVPAGNVIALVDAIRQVIDEDDELLQKMGIDGYNAVKERHNAPIEAEKLLNFIGCNSVN